MFMNKQNDLTMTWESVNSSMITTECNSHVDKMNRTSDNVYSVIRVIKDTTFAFNNSLDSNIFIVNNCSDNNNNSSANCTEETKEYGQELHIIVLMSSVYGLVFLLSVLGNLSVLCMIIKDRRFHSPVYYLIGNLAAADIGATILVYPFNLMNHLLNGWQFGPFMCKAVPYLQAVFVCASVNTLVVIAVDRYIGICHVMRQRNTKNKARIIILSIWLLAMCCMIPWAVFFDVYQQVLDGKTYTFCNEIWPKEWQQQLFFLGVVFTMCYALPLLFIIACYSMIGYRVCNRNAPGITSSIDVIRKSKIRVLKMLVMVVALFTLSWMPMYIIRILWLFKTLPQDSIYPDYIIPFAQWLGTSNCCMNPLVYCFFSEKIRKRIWAMMCCSRYSSETLSVYSTQIVRRDGGNRIPFVSKSESNFRGEKHLLKSTGNHTNGLGIYNNRSIHNSHSTISSSDVITLSESSGKQKFDSTNV